MALNGVCELSSLLRVDDIEKTELIRKKNSLELAIKQQEGRLIYEVEEHERLIGDANAAMERYSDVASSVEFSELQLNHVSSNASSMRIQDIESSISVFSSDLGATVAGMERLEGVAGRVEAAANEATAIREKNVDHQLACAQDHLSTLTDEYDKVSQEIMCVGQEICRDKDIVGSLDEQTADVTTQAESLHRQLTQAEEEYCISESARGEADQFVHQLRDDIRKLEFHNSAELGKQAQTIAQTQEKVHAEEQTIGNIDSEIVGLAELDTAARAGLEETARLETEISTAITQAEESLLAQRAEVSELTLSTSRVASETLSLRNLKASSSAQSFQGRAEALQEDIAGVEQNAAEMRAELSLTLGQIERSAPHEQIQALEHELQEAGVACGTAEQQTAQDGQYVKSNAQELEQAARELSSLTHALEQTRFQAQQRKTNLEELRGSTTADINAAELEELERAADDRARLIAAEQQLAGKLSKGSHGAFTQLTARTEELHLLRRQIDEIERTRAVEHFASQKQARISSARDEILSQHRQEVTVLRKTLMEEDRRFQRRHLEATAARNVRKAELERDLRQLDIERGSLQAQLNAPSSSEGQGPEHSAAAGPVCPVPAKESAAEVVAEQGSPTGVNQVAGTAPTNPAPEKQPGKAKKAASQQHGKEAKMRVARK